MPFLTRWAVRLALLFWLVAAGWGALMLTHRALGVPVWAWSLHSLHMEWMAVGFALQFVMGVAYWILPRFGAERRRPSLAYLGWLMVLGGLGVHVGGWGPGRWLETVGTCLFLLHAWPRVKPPTPYPLPEQRPDA